MFLLSRALRRLRLETTKQPLMGCGRVFRDHRSFPLSPPLLIVTLPPRRGCCTGAATVLAEQGPHQLDTPAICDVQQRLSTSKLRVSSSLDAARVSLSSWLAVSRPSAIISDKHGRAVASEYGSTAAAASSRPAPPSPSRHEPEIGNQTTYVSARMVYT